MLVTRCVDDVSKVGSIVKDAEEVRALVETAGGFERADGDAEGAPLDMIPREAAFYGGSDGGGGDDDDDGNDEGGGAVSVSSRGRVIAYDAEKSDGGVEVDWSLVRVVHGDEAQ